MPAAERSLSLKRSAAGEESCAAGFYVLSGYKMAAEGTLASLFSDIKEAAGKCGDIELYPLSRTFF